MSATLRFRKYVLEHAPKPFLYECSITSLQRLSNNCNSFYTFRVIPKCGDSYIELVSNVCQNFWSDGTDKMAVQVDFGHFTNILRIYSFKWYGLKSWRLMLVNFVPHNKSFQECGSAGVAVSREVVSFV